MITLPQVPPRPPPKRFDHLSFSSVNTFQSCPLRWYFKYVLGLPVTTISSSLVFGSALHASVQYHFEQLLVGRQSTDLEALVSVYQDAWESYIDKKILFPKGEDCQTLANLAVRLLQAFLKSDFAHPKGVILGVEEELRGVVMPGCPELVARVDLLIDTGAELAVSDFKTSRNTWSEGKVDDGAPQLLLYSELVKPIAEGRPVKLSFAVLTKAKFPTLTVHDVPLEVQQVERTKRIVERVWQAIQAGHFYPNPSPMNCSTCSYRGPCQKWTG
jgi:putative RecB family exonuclease